MSVLAGILAGIAAKVGAPIIKGILEQTVGGQVSEIGGKVIDEIAAQAGVARDQLEATIELHPESINAIVKETEADMPRLIALWQTGLQGQFALLQAETAKGGLDSAWRWGWMYLLGFFWAWLIVIVPVLNLFMRLSGSAATLEMIVTISTVLTLTSWFIALYMGGHTLKELGTNIRDAFSARSK
jgi:hypothetical protein